MSRIAILIDGNNFYKGCQLNFNRTDVDFRKLGQKFCHHLGGELLRIYYYNAYVSKTIDPLGFGKQQKFFDNLRATQFITLKLGHLVYHRIRNEQGVSSQYFPTEKGIDVQIAVDMIRLSLLKAAEIIILVSGDSDYIHAVRFTKDLGCNVHIASFPLGGSNELRVEGDGAINMDLAFIQDCFIRPTPPISPYFKRETMTRYGFPATPRIDYDGNASMIIGAEQPGLSPETAATFDDGFYVPEDSMDMDQQQDPLSEGAAPQEENIPPQSDAQ